MKYNLEGFGYGNNIEVTEDEIIKLIEKATKISTTEGKLTTQKGLLILNLLKYEKIEIILKKLGDTLDFDKTLL